MMPGTPTDRKGESREIPTCADLTDDRIIDFQQGRMENGAASDIARHLAACPACRIRTEEIQRISALFQDSTRLNPEVTIPESVDRAVSEEIRKVAALCRQGRTVPGPARRTRFRQWLAAAAACLLFGFVGILGGMVLERRMRPSLAARQDLPFPSRAESEIQTLRAGHARLEKRVAELSDRLGREKTEKESFAARLGDAAAEISALDERLRASSRLVARLRKTLEEQAREIRDSTSQLREAEKQLSALRREKERTGALLAALKAEQQKTREVERTSRTGTGDLNGDGKVDVMDGMLLCRYILEGRPAVDLRTGDVNGDERVDVGDALLALKRSWQQN
jgi:hypothetical protein